MFSRIAVLISLVGLCSCGDPEYTLDADLKDILNEYTAKTGIVDSRFVDLAELVPEDWDKVHLVGRRANPFHVVDDIGFRLNNWGLALGNEFHAQAFFVKDGRVIRHSSLSVLQTGAAVTLSRECARLELILSLEHPSRYTPNAQEGLRAYWRAPIDAHGLFCSHCVPMDRLQSRCSAEPFLTPHSDVNSDTMARRTCEVTRNYDLPIITPVMSYAHFQRTTKSYSVHNCYHPTKVHSTSYGVGVDAWGDAIKTDDSRTSDLLLASGEVRSNGWIRLAVKFDAREFDPRSTRLQILIDPIRSLGTSGNDENEGDFDAAFKIEVDPAKRKGVMLIRLGKPKAWWIKKGLRTLPDGFGVSVPTRLFETVMGRFRFKVSSLNQRVPTEESIVHDRIPEALTAAISVSPQTLYNAFCAPEEHVEE